MIVLWCFTASNAWPQTHSPGTARNVDSACSSSPDISANTLLLKHSNFFCQGKVYDLKKDPPYKNSFRPEVKYNVYSAVGYDLANSMMLVGPSGVVIIDTLGEEASAETVIQQFKSITNISGPLPVKAIIYTHNHIDHIGGVDAFIKASGKPPCPPQNTPVNDTPYAPRDSNNCVEVVGQANIIDGLTQTATISGTIINPRSAYMYGAYIGTGNGNNRINDGIGPDENSGTSMFRLPSHMFNQNLQFTVAGMVLQLVYVPSETNDELSVFVPDNQNGGSGDGGLLFSAEVIQGPSFPNLYSLRGTSFRSPATWYKSVDTLRNFNSWCMVPSHGVPLCGADYIQTLLVNFRDAVQFTHDQTVRLMDQGYTPDELVERVQLPNYLLANLENLKQAMPDSNMDPIDYLREFYGSVRQSVREIYSGYLGWFPADPVDLNPIPPIVAAQKYIDLMGGETPVQQAAQAALDANDNQWAAELATLLIRVNHENYPARKIKAEAFDNLAQAVTNPNWRNWYITSADELCWHELANGTCTPFIDPPIPGGLTSPGFVAALPPDKWVSSWTIWLDPNSSPQQASLGFLFPAEGTGFPQEQYILRRDGAVVRFLTTASRDFNDVWNAPATTLVQITRSNIWPLPSNLLTLLNNEAQLIKDGNLTAFTTALQNGCYEKGQPAKLVEVLKGSCTTLKNFTEMFQQPLIHSPKLTLR
jgi:alkyl sulfatase BDS1-like metallo-beta-lactamase superfamily hydrolase